MGGEGLQATSSIAGAMKSLEDCGWVEWSEVHQILLLNPVSDSYRIWISTNTSEPGDSPHFGCCKYCEVLYTANSDSQRMSKAQQSVARAVGTCQGSQCHRTGVTWQSLFLLISHWSLSRLLAIIKAPWTPRSFWTKTSFWFWAELFLKGKKKKISSVL